MGTIPQVASAMKWIMGPVSKRIGEETGFSQRETKVNGSVMMQALVFSSLEKADWGYPDLVSSTLNAGVEVTKQGLEQRFTEKSAEMARQVLDAALHLVIESEPRALPILERFTGVYIRDSTVIGLPKELEDVWAGGASSHGSSAGVKLHVRLEICSGQLAGPVLAPAREHDQRSPFQTEALPKGAVRMGDLGFFNLAQFASDAANEVFWFSRYKSGTLLYDQHAQPIPLLAWLAQQSATRFECPVRLGQKEQLPCRLIVERVPPAVYAKRLENLHDYARKKQVEPTPELIALAEWTLILTNIPVALLSIEEAFVLVHVRWQIELLFRRWKSLFQVDEWRSTKRWRILTELYAKLLAVIIENWIVLTELAHCPSFSFWKAALLVRKFATLLAVALPVVSHLEAVLVLIGLHFRSHCRLGRAKSRPSFLQRLENLACISLP
jgi:hypothetical protein